MSADRDFMLLGVADDALNSVKGLANATLAVMHHSDRAFKPTKAKHIALVGEMVGRFEQYVLAIQPAILTYSATMSEAELRAWAAELVKAAQE